jgi:molybdopterin molybdotransferase
MQYGAPTIFLSYDIYIAKLVCMWKRKKFSYIPVDKAHQILRKVVRVKARREMVPTHQAYKRVLAEYVISDVNIPPFSVSHFDGYAVRAEDTSQASMNHPVFLKVVSPVKGHECKVNFGEAAYILTGTRLTTGANAVIPVERVKLMDETIEIRHVIPQYENITPAGTDLKKGEKVFKTGQVLRAQDVKLLMELKKWKVWVFEKPIVAMMSVGSELTDQVEEADVKKFNSHGPMISTLINEAGGIPLDLGIVPDDVSVIRMMLKEGLEKADIVATIGGSSVGKRDYVWEVLNSLAPSATIRGVKVHPGRVTSLGVVNGKAIVMLPGHVQSTLVGFCTLLLPLIRLMSGELPNIIHLTLKAVMSQKLVVKKFVPFEKVRFVKVAKADDHYVVKPILGDSSLISVVTKADGFIMVPRRRTVIEEGEEVSVHLISGLFPIS